VAVWLWSREHNVGATINDVSTLANQLTGSSDASVSAATDTKSIFRDRMKMT